jgi:sugar transferase EpsL
MPYLLQRLLALIALGVLSPVLAGVGMVVAMVDGRPVLFKQQRIGRDRAEFTIYKFRTMVRDADALLDARGVTANRLTRTGRLLRQSGVDELPQLVNIARGEMALVGPRAMLPEVAANLPARYLRRFEVLPGLTGQAQVSGRNELLWSKRLQLDVEYVDQRSILTDLRILMRTIAVVLVGHGHTPDRNSADVDDLGLIKTTTS